MQRPRPETVTLDDILITEELHLRSLRSPNWQAEAQAMRSLAQQMARDSTSLMQTLVATALKLCQAGTAGVSLLETTPNGEEIFRWNVLAGTLVHHVGGSIPRNFSPCSVCLEQGSPVLFSHPEQYFTYFQSANTPIVEGLVLPLIADNHALGTIWIMSHDEKRQFDSEDVRVMTSLADFTATALLLQQRQTGELLAVNAALEAEIVERRQAEERSRALISNLPGGAAFVVDRDLRYLLAEGKALAIAGFKPEDFVGHTIFEVLPPELAANYEVLYRRALAGEPFEHEHHAHDHTYISRGTPLRAENGEIYGVLAVSYDISDRKQVENALRESEERFRLFVTASSDIVYKMSADWREMYSLVGKNFLVSTEDSSQTWIETYIPPEEQPRVWAAIQLAIDTKSAFELEHRVIQQDGAIGWMFSRAVPTLNEQGDIVEWFGTASDVTERKRSEEALRESEERFRTLANTAPALIWYNDAQGNNLFLNQYFLDFTGKSAGQIRGEGWYTLIHPDDAEDYIADYLAAVREQRSWHNRNRIRRHDGVWRWHDNYAQPLFNADGVYLAHVGVMIDNTDAIEAEIALRESEAKYRSLFDSIDEGTCLIERLPLRPDGLRDYRYIAMNPAMQEMFGIPDLSGQSIRDNFPNEIEDWYDDYDRVLETGQPIRFERESEPQGMVLEMFVTRVEDGAGKRLIAVMKDVTERKRTEEQQAFLLKFSDALRAEPDADSVASRAVGMLAEHLRLDRCWFSEVFEQQGISKVGPEYHRPDLPPMSGVFRLSDYPETMRQLVTQPMVIHNVANDPDFSDSKKALLDQLHLRALLVVSLRKGQHQVIWAMAAAMVTPRHWNESERVLLEEVGEHAWAAIERARAEAALRESELQRVREQSEREQERQRAESLAELDHAKTLFFSNVSHEFRTPLTLSLAPLQDALSDSVDPLSPPQRERLELAHRNANRLLKLVNTLLDFSRIEAGRMEAVYEPTDLALFTTELASVFRSAIERAGLRLIVDCPLLPESVYVDREMWEKIVLNLLSNAFKFTLEGEITVRLHRADSDRVQLQIQDTGTGIAPEELPHLFERFYQVRGAKARTHEGSGIGLALVQELIKMHGGTVEVSSTVGQGTCFTVTIPLGTAHLQGDRLRSDVGDRTTATRTLESTASGAAPYVEEAEHWLPEPGNRKQETGNREKRAEAVEEATTNYQLPITNHQLPITNYPHTTHHSARILLVDDNADMRDYLTRILGEHVQVEAVADGATALAAAQKQVPDLVLSDVMMPGLDGFGLLGALRADPRTREVPIILLSARAGEEAIIEGLQAGADDYLIKPFSAQELVSRVNAHLQMAQLRSETLHQERTISRRKDELLSTVSHELNTPLVSILGWTRLLRANPPSSAMLTKALDTIERNATLQAKLVQDLLDMSRITAGKLRLNLQPVDLKSVIEMAIATVAQTATAKEINLVWHKTSAAQDTHSIVVMGDSDRLEQVICNLLTNAVKFTPKSGNVSIELSVVDDGNPPQTSYAEIRVIDTGIGIAADFLPHVFDRLSQARDSDSAKGLGLGLAIAQHLVELHNGTIHAQSAGEGQGATFIVRLPVASTLG